MILAETAFVLFFFAATMDAAITQSISPSKATSGPIFISSKKPHRGRKAFESHLSPLKIPSWINNPKKNKVEALEDSFRNFIVLNASGPELLEDQIFIMDDDDKYVNLQLPNDQQLREMSENRHKLNQDDDCLETPVTGFPAYKISESKTRNSKNLPINLNYSKKIAPSTEQDPSSLFSDTPTSTGSKSPELSV